MSDRLDRWNELGPWMKARYERMGMTQAAFCKAAGISDTHWRPIERGQASSVPRPGRLSSISTALGLPPEALAQIIGGALTVDSFDSPPPGGGGSPVSIGPDELQLAALAGKLTPERRAIVEQLARSLLAEQDD